MVFQVTVQAVSPMATASSGGEVAASAASVASPSSAQKMSERMEQKVAETQQELTAAKEENDDQAGTMESQVSSRLEAKLKLFCQIMPILPVPLNWSTVLTLRFPHRNQTSSL